MARLPVYHSQRNISTTQPIAPIENPMWGEVKKIAQLGQDLAVKWQQIKNDAEELDGKEKLERGLNSLLHGANDYNDYTSQADLDKAEKDLISQNNKLIENIASGFTNQRNAERFIQTYQHAPYNNAQRIQAAFRKKTGDLTRANTTLSYERNKNEFVSTGNPAYKKNYLADLKTASPFYSKEEMAKMKIKIDEWDFDYVKALAVNDPNGAEEYLRKMPNAFNSDKGRSALSYIEAQRNRLEREQKRHDKLVKEGMNEEAAWDLANTQTSNAVMVESEFSNIEDLKKTAPVEYVLHNLELQDNIQRMGFEGLSETDYKKYRKLASIDLINAIKNEADTFDDAWIQESVMSTGLQAMKNDGKISGKAWSDDMSVVMIRDFYGMAKEKGLDLRATDSDSRDRAKKLAAKAISNTIERVSGGYGKEYNSIFLNGQKVSKAPIKPETANYENPDYIIENGKKIYNETGIEVEIEQ